MAAQAHDMLCFDAEGPEGASIRAADEALSKLDEQNEEQEEEYQRVADREFVLYKEMFKDAAYEAKCYPHMFPFGHGHFGSCKIRVRFIGYRNHLLKHFQIMPLLWNETSLKYGCRGPRARRQGWNSRCATSALAAREGGT